MPTVKAPDGRDMYSAFEPESEYHGGPGGGKVIRKFLCGMHFEGEYADDNENGHGSLDMSDGSKYVGQWKDGQYHGSGKYTSADGQVTEGEWMEGLLIPLWQIESHGTCHGSASGSGGVGTIYRGGSQRSQTCRRCITRGKPARQPTDDE